MSARHGVSLQRIDLASAPGIDDAEAFAIAERGYVSIVVDVHDGDDGDPVDGTPGVFRLYTSHDLAGRFAPVPTSNQMMDALTVTADAKKRAVAPLDGVPGSYGKIVFEPSGVGSGPSFAYVSVAVG